MTEQVARFRSGTASRTEGVLVVAAAAVAVVGLALLATRENTILLLGALAVAGLIALVAVIGPERTGILILVGGFFTAPFYKGTAPTPGSPATGTDALLLLGFVFLIPNVLRGRLRLPLVYWFGVSLVLIVGILASAGSTDPAVSFISLGFWMVVMAGLTCAFASWLPSRTLVDLFAASFVAGQIFSFVAGWARGNIAQDRHAGLSTHFNYFGEAGMLSVGLLIYLAYRYFGRSKLISVAIVVVAAVCVATVVLSGSRAATIVLAVLILMIPVVERSAITGFVWAALVALALVVLPLVADTLSQVSSVDRLLGGGGAGYSDSARNIGLDEGLDRFFANPILGDGLIELYEIHNNFLEVAVAIGVFGLAGYLMVLYAFARPILGAGQMRRLCYPVWGYIGFGATVPSLYDRSIWAVVALSAVAMVEFEQIRRDRPLTSPTGRHLNPGTRPIPSSGVRSGADV